MSEETLTGIGSSCGHSAQVCRQRGQHLEVARCVTLSCGNHRGSSVHRRRPRGPAMECSVALLAEWAGGRRDLPGRWALRVGRLAPLRGKYLTIVKSPCSRFDSSRSARLDRAAQSTQGPSRFGSTHGRGIQAGQGPRAAVGVANSHQV